MMSVLRIYKIVCKFPKQFKDSLGLFMEKLAAGRPMPRSGGDGREKEREKLNFLAFSFPRYLPFYLLPREPRASRGVISPVTVVRDNLSFSPRFSPFSLTCAPRCKSGRLQPQRQK